MLRFHPGFQLFVIPVVVLFWSAQYKINKVQSETNSNRGLQAKQTPIGLNIRQFLLAKFELLITVFPRLQCAKWEHLLTLMQPGSWSLQV